MKKTLLIISMAAALASCSKTAPEQAPSWRQEPQTAILTVKISEDTQTKSTLTTWQDAAVSSATVYVFNSDGTYDNSATASGATVSVRCTVGSDKKVYVVVNKTFSDAFANTTALEAKNTVLSDNTSAHFVMSGKVEGVNVSSGTNGPVDVEVMRQVAKVSIGSITNSISESGWRDLEFKVKGIYLINVAGGNKPLFSNTYTPSVWYNQMQYVSGACNDKLYDSLSKTIANGGTLNELHTFYCMPNPTGTDANGGSWSPRKTRLVIETTIGTGTYYYPITLNQVVGNTHYSISNLVITRLGATSPDESVEGSLMTFGIDVKAWTDNDMSTITI